MDFRSLTVEKETELHRFNYAPIPLNLIIALLKVFIQLQLQILMKILAF